MSSSTNNYSNFINTLNIPNDKDRLSSDNNKSVINNDLANIKEKQSIPANLPIMNANNPIKTNQITDKPSPAVKKTVLNPIWLSVSESAKLGGVTQKTIRRAIHSKKLKYKIVKDRYQIDFSSAITYLNRNTKLKNKLLFNGLGQYIEKWRE